VEGQKWGPSQGRNLRSLREQKHFTQTALARSVGTRGVSVETVRHWESGEHAPTQKNLDALAGLLGVSVPRLFDQVLVLMPEFEIGLHLFCAPPIAARESFVVEPILRKLRALKTDWYKLEFFDMAKLRNELNAYVGADLPLDSVRQKAKFVAWARAGARAVVLTAFRPVQENEWSEYIDTVRLLKDECCIIIVQTVNPFHLQMVVRSSSAYEPKSYAVDLALRDDADDADPAGVQREIPGCCLETMRAVRDGRQPERNRCVNTLKDAGVITVAEEKLAFRPGWERMVPV
jgi:transcriptional regulator with XRE-family HTH domain